MGLPGTSCCSKKFHHNDLCITNQSFIWKNPEEKDSVSDAAIGSSIKNGGKMMLAMHQ